MKYKNKEQALFTFSWEKKEEIPRRRKSHTRLQVFSDFSSCLLSPLNLPSYTMQKNQ